MTSISPGSGAAGASGSRGSTPGQRADRLAEVGRVDRLHPDAEPQAHDLHFPEFFRVDLIGE